MVTLQPSKYGNMEYFTNPRNQSEMEKNIGKFLEACDNLGVPSFEIEELTQCTNLYAVISAICTYGQSAQQAELENTPDIVDLEDIELDVDLDDEQPEPHRDTEVRSSIFLYTALLNQHSKAEKR
eukprot:TRINITY_DN665_c0_g5_i5.p2 TRINITY_DN665_c0_g5~~TRINITY_DN665_c0_g5_i5.p2  ORF type:complete len:125 (+),score=21.29 TRINITY_DN665_c0_g5_i5:305-679(+)